MDEQPVEQPQVETPAAPSLDQRIGALKGEARDHWQLNGSIIEAEKLNGTSSETPVSTDTGAPSKEDAAQTEAESEPANKEQPRSRGDRDFRGLRSKLSDTERELIAAKAKLELYEKGQSAVTRPSAPETLPVKPQSTRPPFPKISQFKTVEEFEQKVDEWRVNDEKWVQAQVAETVGGLKRESQTEKQQAFKTQQIETGKKEFKDFEAVAFNSKIPASDILLAALDKRSDGYKIRYWLGSHPNEAAELAQATHINGLAELYRKDPVSAMYMVGRAEALAEAEFKRISASFTKSANENPSRPRPRPTSEVGVVPRGNVVEDELSDAVKRGDQSAFNRIQNERDAKRFKSGQY